MDTTFEVRSATKKINYPLDLFYLMKRGDRLFREITQKVELNKL